MKGGENGGERPFAMSRQVVVFAVFAVVASYFLWAEHEAHIRALFPYFPWLIVLLCPLMHLFMHHGHGHNHGPDDREDRRAP